MRSGYDPTRVVASASPQLRAETPPSYPRRERRGRSSELSRAVLVTGGAGFIGSHLADGLLACGYRVRALDDLTPQVHGAAARPDYLSDDVELLRGDVRDEATVREALEGMDAVV